MENKELLYDLEYRVNELRKSYLDELQFSDNLTLKEILDMGFNNAYIFSNTLERYISLGFKELGENGKYWSSDLKYLTEKQLNVLMKYKGYDLSDEDYYELDLELVNKADEELFVVKE